MNADEDVVGSSAFLTTFRFRVFQPCILKTTPQCSGPWWTILKSAIIQTDALFTKYFEGHEIIK